MAYAPADTLTDAILDFLASSPTAAQIVAYEPPPALQQRLSELLAINRTQRLSDDEQTELDEYLRLNRFMSRLRLKARLRLS